LLDVGLQLEELGSGGDVAKNNRDVSIFLATIAVFYN
jgi:hypothetical protein